MSGKTIFCPHCHAELELQEEYFGMEVSCPVCNENFVAGNDAPVAGNDAPVAGASRKIQFNLNRILNMEKKSPAEETEEDELVALDENDCLVDIDDSGFDELSEDGDDLPEPDPGFVEESYFKKKISPKIAVILVLVGVITGLVFVEGVAEDKELGVYCGWALFFAILFPGIYSLYCFCSSNGRKKHWKRDLVRELFFASVLVEKGANVSEKVFDLCGVVFESIPLISFIPMIIKGIAKNKKARYCLFREPFYDEVQELDLEYLKKLDVLRRFGKDKTQLIAPMETLFAPAFCGVEELEEFQYAIGEKDEVYRYNLEEVTKVYTFEDQLLIYTGIWGYSLGKMIYERTEAFFFKDITDIRTESEFKVHTKYAPQGCLSVIFPWTGKPIKTVYKEAERFVLTSGSGNSIGLTIGFEDSIEVTGSSYTRRNDNERIIHAIRKMIEEKKVVNNG